MSVYALAASRGTLYVGGSFAQIGGEGRSYFAVIDTVTGTAASSFGG